MPKISKILSNAMKKLLILLFITTCFFLHFLENLKIALFCRAINSNSWNASSGFFSTKSHRKVIDNLSCIRFPTVNGPSLIFSATNETSLHSLALQASLSAVLFARPDQIYRSSGTCVE